MVHLIDTHCHLTSELLSDDTDEILARSRRAGVHEMITVATDTCDARQAVMLAGHYDGVWAAIGIHPHNAARIEEEHIEELRELSHHPSVLAWGEIGLDYHYDFASPDTQQDALNWQLDFAKHRNLPIVIHCREAHADTVKILEDHHLQNHPVVFHCFGGSLTEAHAIMDRGWRLSITGTVTFKKNKELQEIVRSFPLELLMLETDAPYLSPEPHRKRKPNEPALLLHIAECVAQLKGHTLQEVAHATTRSAHEFFRLE